MSAIANFFNPPPKNEEPKKTTPKTPFEDLTKYEEVKITTPQTPLRYSSNSYAEPATIKHHKKTNTLTKKKVEKYFQSMKTKINKIVSETKEHLVKLETSAKKRKTAKRKYYSSSPEVIPLSENKYSPEPDFSSPKDEIIEIREEEIPVINEDETPTTSAAKEIPIIKEGGYKRKKR